MEDPVKALLWLAGICFTVACCGGSLMLGMALVGRWLGWAPVNLTVNLNDYRDIQ
jgi:hypothetical protein